MRLRITNFGGLAPKQTELNLNQTYATIARDVNLERGSIKPWKKPRKISPETGESIYVDDCCVIKASCDARFAKTGIECDGILAATGVARGPVFTTECPPQWEPLGFPCNMSAPSVSVGGESREDFSLELRSYYYTVVNRMGWESQPSYPSNWARVNTLSPVTVSGFDAPSNAVSVRIYRAQTPLDFGAEKQENVDDAVYLFVGEVPVGGSFTDNIKVAGEACLTEEFDAPPDNLRELCSWREGRLAGLTGKFFAMTERGQPHAWNRKFLVGFYDNPIALRCTARTAYVLTNGRPVALRIHGDCDDGAHPIEVLEAPVSLPIVSRRSAAVHLDGVVYASRYGLVVMSGNQTAIITRDYYTEDQWEQLLPHTMVGEVCDGVYYGTTATTTIRFNLPDDIFATPDNNALTTLSLRPQAMHTAENGRLYMALNNGTYEWNTGEDDMTYHWRGVVQAMPGNARLSAFRVRTSQNITVTHLLNTGKVQTIEVGNEPTRLPVGYMGRDWHVDLMGSGEVLEYVLATSIRELAG